MCEVLNEGDLAHVQCNKIHNCIHYVVVYYQQKVKWKVTPPP